MGEQKREVVRSTISSCGCAMRTIEWVVVVSEGKLYTRSSTISRHTGQFGLFTLGQFLRISTSSTRRDLG